MAGRRRGSATWLVRGPGLDGQRMNAVAQLLGQQGIDQPVPFDTAFAREGLRRDLHPEMRFASGPRPCMAGMQVRFIDDLRASGRSPSASRALMMSLTLMDEVSRCEAEGAARPAALHCGGSACGRRELPHNR